MDSKIKNKIVILVIVILIIGFACIFININKNNVAIDESSESLNIIKEENSYTVYDKSGENIIAQNLTEEETKMYIENPNYSLDPRTVK